MPIDFQKKCILCERNIFKHNFLNLRNTLKQYSGRLMNNQYIVKSAYFIKNKCSLLNYQKCIEPPLLINVHLLSGLLFMSEFLH